MNNNIIVIHGTLRVHLLMLPASSEWCSLSGDRTGLPWSKLLSGPLILHVH